MPMNTAGSGRYATLYAAPDKKSARCEALLNEAVTILTRKTDCTFML